MPIHLEDAHVKPHHACSFIHCITFAAAPLVTCSFPRMMRTRCWCSWLAVSMRLSKQHCEACESMLCGTLLQHDLSGEQGYLTAWLLHHACVIAPSLLHHGYIRAGSCEHHGCTKATLHMFAPVLLLSIAVAAAGLEGNPGVCISYSIKSDSSQNGSCRGYFSGCHNSPRPCSGRSSCRSTTLGVKAEAEAFAAVSGLAAEAGRRASSCSATAARPGKLFFFCHSQSPVRLSWYSFPTGLCILTRLSHHNSAHQDVSRLANPTLACSQVSASSECLYAQEFVKERSALSTSLWNAASSWHVAAPSATQSNKHASACCICNGQRSGCTLAQETASAHTAVSVTQLHVILGSPPHCRMSSSNKLIIKTSLFAAAGQTGQGASGAALLPGWRRL